ncbi:MAG TPA: copper-binding protein [Candidatus Elarobacter sp.]|nr:copper-binding protein [Candidatus Elarobacter sp.]
MAALTFASAIHGNVVSVDRAHDLLVIHHKAHAGMMMEMTMAVKMADRHALAGLRKGQFVELRCDESRNPWVCVRR